MAGETTAQGALRTAIYTRLNADVAITETLLKNFPKTNTSMPYIFIGECNMAGDTTKDYWGGWYTQTIHCWSADHTGAECESMVSNVRSSLTTSDLTVTGFSNAGPGILQMIQTFPSVNDDYSRNSVGESCWHGVIQIKFLIQSTAR